MPRIDLCSTAEVAPGNALKVETGELTLAVFNVDGEYYVTDDLCTHGPGSLYEAFEPAEARRILGRWEIHHTPKHASWLNMAETELSVLGRQCLDRRIADQATLTKEVAAWEKECNERSVKVDWQFTTADARIKLKRLYPTIEMR